MLLPLLSSANQERKSKKNVKRAIGKKNKTKQTTFSHCKAATLYRPSNGGDE